MSYIPYGKQSIEQDDIDAVLKVLDSDWLTTGPKVEEFEQTLADYVNAEYGIAVSSGTAALHCAMYALGIGPGDEVIVPPITFAATANCVVYQGGTPVFVDVSPDTLIIDPLKVEEKITARTKAIISVDYAGQPCDYNALRGIADKYGLAFVSDGCHALGAVYEGQKIGSLADMTIFSFHPVKHITSGEGGMITTNNLEYAEKIRQFRNHGIDADYKQREKNGAWFYQIKDIGFNYRLTDIQCALGISQLKKLPEFLKQRRYIASVYDRAFQEVPEIEPLVVKNNIEHAYHLYVIRLSSDLDRAAVFTELHNKSIGVNVHYIPVHLHPFYKEKFGYQEGDCPVAEQAYNCILSLPVFPHLMMNDMKFVISSISSLSKKL